MILFTSKRIELPVEVTAKTESVTVFFWQRSEPFFSVIVRLNDTAKVLEQTVMVFWQRSEPFLCASVGFDDERAHTVVSLCELCSRELVDSENGWRLIRSIDGLDLGTWAEREFANFAVDVRW